MTSQRQPLTIGSMFGHYRLDRLLGRGGMGEVYEAYDLRKGRSVAVKVLIEKLAQDRDYRERFQREADAAARLREPHIVPIHDYGEIDGRLYIDMRLVDGSSLSSRLREYGPLPPEEAVAVIRQIASALDAAHGQGLIHRDIKPDNILLTPEGFAYLVDFGIAHSGSDHSLTTNGALIGSFSYMAPERFRADRTTPAVDIYALTCVLYECLTAKRPYRGKTDAEIISAHLFEPVPRPSVLRSNLTPALDAVIARGMAKEAKQRYGGAGELAVAAQSALSATGAVTDAPTRASVPAGAPSPETGTGRTTNTAPPPRDRRRRRLTAVSLLLAAVLAAAAGFGAWTVLEHQFAGTAVADTSALRGDDIELLKLVGPTGYKRASCVHENPDASTTVMFFCAANQTASDPAARFFRFRNRDLLDDYYNTLARIFQAGSCPGEPAGADSASMVDGKEIGRKACAANRAETPSAPKPTLMLTNNDALAMVLYIWEAPADQPYRDYVARQNFWQFRSADGAYDPDYFTQADRGLFGHLSADFTPGNCRHWEPGNVAAAQISCGTRIGFPGATFYGFTDAHAADALYRADLGLYQGHTCGGGAGSEDVWRTSVGSVGRYFCLTDHDPANGTHTCLLALHDRFQLLAELCTVPNDSPEPGPKTEPELLAWFQKYFG